MSEAAFLTAVIALAHEHGWLVAHFRPAVLRSGQWATHMQGDKGFPDLVLARKGRIVIAELKREDGQLSEGQRAWLAEMAPQPGVFVWRPSMWNTIVEVLT